MSTTAVSVHAGLNVTLPLFLTCRNYLMAFQEHPFVFL